MKFALSLLLSGIIFHAAACLAGQTTFNLSATVPAATGVSITVDSVDATTNAFTALTSGTTALSFDPMSYNSALGIYTPNHYFAINVGASGGAGAPDMTLTYNEGANPNGTSNGLGYKSTISFARETVTSTGTPVEISLPQGKMRLIDVQGTHIPYTEIAPGFARIYLGIWTGKAGGFSPDPANGQPFSNADAPGVYTGSLSITAVVN